MRQYNELPPAASCRRIDFDRIRVIVLESDPPQYALEVRGTKPYSNMEVDLVPLVYVRRPEYWEIEVVGCLRGFGLPSPAPYTASISLASSLGSEGIEVLGATRSAKRTVPPEEEVEVCCHGWSARQFARHPDSRPLWVRGQCEVPDGYSVELKRHEPQGINPEVLLLERVVHEPTAPSRQLIEEVEVEYFEEATSNYESVTILPDGVSIPVLAFPA